MYGHDSVLLPYISLFNFILYRLSKLTPTMLDAKLRVHYVYFLFVVVWVLEILFVLRHRGSLEFLSSFHSSFTPCLAFSVCQPKRCCAGPVRTGNALGGKARRGAATLPLVGGVVCGDEHHVNLLALDHHRNMAK